MTLKRLNHLFIIDTVTDPMDLIAVQSDIQLLHFRNTEWAKLGTFAFSTESNG